jgi:hypothetical protein
VCPLRLAGRLRWRRPGRVSWQLAARQGPWRNVGGLVVNSHVGRPCGQRRGGAMCGACSTGQSWWDSLGRAAWLVAAGQMAPMLAAVAFTTQPCGPAWAVSAWVACGGAWFGFGLLFAPPGSTRSLCFGKGLNWRALGSARTIAAAATLRTAGGGGAAGQPRHTAADPVARGPATSAHVAASFRFASPSVPNMLELGHSPSSTPRP